jgi:hypothetical protein
MEEKKIKSKETISVEHDRIWTSFLLSCSEEIKLSCSISPPERL